LESIYQGDFLSEEDLPMVTPMSSTTDRVIESLMSDPRTKDSGIEVSCTGGIVTLAGSVKSAAVRDAAEEIARHQDGVVTVINEIKVG
jgi:osmotically-inducible protein OsmY